MSDFEVSDERETNYGNIKEVLKWGRKMPMNQRRFRNGIKMRSSPITREFLSRKAPCDIPVRPTHIYG